MLLLVHRRNHELCHITTGKVTHNQPTCANLAIVYCVPRTNKNGRVALFNCEGHKCEIYRIALINYNTNEAA